MTRSINFSCFCEIRFLQLTGVEKTRRLKTWNAVLWIKFGLCSNSRLKEKRDFYIRNVVCPWCIAILSVVIFYFDSPYSPSEVKYEQSHDVTCMWICYFWCSSKCRRPICYVVTQQSHIFSTLANIYSAPGEQPLSTVADHFNYGASSSTTSLINETSWKGRECFKRLNNSSECSFSPFHRKSKDLFTSMPCWREWLHIYIIILIGVLSRSGQTLTHMPHRSIGCAVQFEFSLDPIARSPFQFIQLN